MSKYPHDYYNELRNTDEAINDKLVYSQFNFFAKQFAPNYDKKNRYARYENYFNTQAFAEKRDTALAQHVETVPTA